MVEALFILAEVLVLVGEFSTTSRESALIVTYDEEGALKKTG